MINIKCRYNHCKHNNEVLKDEAIKDGNSYYCKDCYKEKILKQQIEEYYSVNLPATTIQILRKVINQLLYVNNYDAEYIMFIIKKIHIGKLKINNPFGLINYCNDGRYIDEWRKHKVSQEFNIIKEQLITYETEDKINYIYKPINKKWTDLI